MKTAFLFIAFFLSANVWAGTKLGVGYAHSCGVKEGKLYCWGWNFYGQLGVGDQVDSTSPREVTAITEPVTQVSSRQTHTCAVVNGGVKCWGKNTFGALGDGTRTNSFLPVDVVGLGAGSGVTKVAAGNAYTCALVRGGVKCWGWGRSCQLGKPKCLGGEPSNGDMELTPRWVDLLGEGSGVTDIAVDDSHTCAVVNGGVKCWGVTFFGKTGDGFGGQRYNREPEDVIGLGAGSGVTAITVGNSQTCAAVNGGVKCWGHPKFVGRGRPESDTVAFRPDWVVGLGAGSGVTDLSTSNFTSCAVRNNDSVWCWGSGTAGQAGNGRMGADNVVFVASKVQGIGGGERVHAAQAGYAHACALVDNGAKCWGWNSFCQLGDGKCTDANSRGVAEPVNGF